MFMNKINTVRIIHKLKCKMLFDNKLGQWYRELNIKLGSRLNYCILSKFKYQFEEDGQDI